MTLGISKFTELVEINPTPHHRSAFVDVFKIKTEYIPSSHDIDVFFIHVLFESQQHLLLRVKANDARTISLFIAQTNLFVWFVISELTQGNCNLKTCIIGNIWVGKLTCRTITLNIKRCNNKRSNVISINRFQC